MYHLPLCSVDHYKQITILAIVPMGANVHGRGGGDSQVCKGRGGGVYGITFQQVMQLFISKFMSQ